MVAILIFYYFHTQQITFKIGNINFKQGIQLLIKNMVAACGNELAVKTTSGWLSRIYYTSMKLKLKKL